MKQQGREWGMKAGGSRNRAAPRGAGKGRLTGVLEVRRAERARECHGGHGPRHWRLVGARCGGAAGAEKREQVDGHGRRRQRRGGRERRSEKAGSTPCVGVRLV